MSAILPGMGRWGLLFALTLCAPAAHAEEEVRIAIASQKTQIEVEGDDLAVFDALAGEPILQEAGRAKVVVRVARGGVAVVGPQNRRLGTGPSLLFEAKKGIKVDGRLYLGRVAFEPDANRKTLTAINRLPVETYLLGIVGSEMSPAWPIEALKAQAVAARTYALQRRMMMRAANKPYDMEATVLSQVYQGAERIRPSVITAVSATRGEVLSFRHRLVEALFHSTCGGTTVSAKEAFGRSVPYLVSQRCAWCRGSNNYRWELRLGLDRIGKKLREARVLAGQPERLERRQGSGPVEVTAGKRVTRLSARQLRSLIGYSVILSDRFSAKTKGSEVVFEGQGFGHGVGMCQWGAKGQADRGLGYRELLLHYYAGAEVKRIY